MNKKDKVWLSQLTIKHQPALNHATIHRINNQYIGRKNTSTMLSCLFNQSSEGAKM